jgi:hypothetical protein
LHKELLTLLPNAAAVLPAKTAPLNLHDATDDFLAAAGDAAALPPEGMAPASQDADSDVAGEVTAAATEAAVLPDADGQRRSHPGSASFNLADSVARDKGWIDPGVAESLISFLEVPKGLTDIRMVCEGTASGLNDMLWAPWFPLPTIDLLLRRAEPGTWMADNDVGEMFLNHVGEMFLNFVLLESIQALCRIDQTKCFPVLSYEVGMH